MSTQQNRKLAYLAALVVLVATGAALGFHVSRGSTELAEDRRVSTPRSAPAADSSRPEDANSRDALTHSSPHQTGAQVYVAPEDAVTIDPDAVALVVRCVNQGGDPIAGVHVQCIITERRPDGDPSNNATVGMFDSLTDDKGEFVLRSRRDHWVQLFLKEEDWQSDPYDASRAVQFTRSTPIEMLLLALSVVRIRAIYDDGTPVASYSTLERPANFDEWIDQPAARRSWGFRFAEDGSARVKAPLDRPLRIRVRGGRAMYPGYT